MPLDPQMKKRIDLIASMRPTPMEQLTHQQARKNVEMAPRPPSPEPAKVENRKILGPHGEIPIRITTPHGKGPFPVLVWFHGGGWVIGSIELTDHLARIFSNNVKCVVVSVDYRLAPEHKFPCAIDDSYAATKWTFDNAKSINVDPTKIAVAGDSAGGNLAACVSLMARDKSGPKLVHQVCLYPVIDNNFNRKSWIDNATGYVLSRTQMMWFWDLYLRNEKDGTHPYVSPLNAADFRGLAPATVITAEFDILRDEGAAYAEKLKKFGVLTDYKCYDGMCHGFVSMWADIDGGKIAINHTSENLKKAFK